MLLFAAWVGLGPTKKGDFSHVGGHLFLVVNQKKIIFRKDNKYQETSYVGGIYKDMEATSNHKDESDFHMCTISTRK